MSTRHDFTTLAEGLSRSFSENASAIALEVAGERCTYAQLADGAHAVCHLIEDAEAAPRDVIAVFGYRSKAVYAGIAGIILSGHGYLPLHPRFPPERLKAILARSRCSTLVLCEECAEPFERFCGDLEPLTVICPEPGERCRALAATARQHRYVLCDRPDHAAPRTVPVAPEAPAYLLFTSGSTGVPKGVAVSHRNVCAYLRYTIDRYQVTSRDRLTQMFDLTFDLSVHDLFVSFLSGACLCVVPEAALMAPAKFIKEAGCTLWFSVPSVAMFMARMRMLKPRSFPALRYSLFCGEALPARTAELWQAAAPGSALENVYGPTETTIAITNYRWHPATSPAECVNGVVPIGRPYPEHRARIVDGRDRPLGAGEPGELCLSGPQVTSGYLDDPVRTAERFVRFPDEPGAIWYRTGDLVRQDDGGCLHYLGRIDDQIKIRGHRIELQEIDTAIRRGAGTDLALCVPSRLEHGRAESVHAVVEGATDESLRARVLEHCKAVLPEYMVPTHVRFVEKLPLNSNGKIDRKALVETNGE